MRVTWHKRARVGDLALHRSNQLDEREVARVEGDQIWLNIGGATFGPFPESNYDFRREVAE